MFGVCCEEGREGGRGERGGEKDNVNCESSSLFVQEAKDNDVEEEEEEEEGAVSGVGD